jgi:hypothetical protein
LNVSAWYLITAWGDSVRGEGGMSKSCQHKPWASPGFWKWAVFSNIPDFHGQFQGFFPKGGSFT